MDLELRHLAFSYGEQPVLRGVSFTASPGELIAVVGPNGVGKSTMFRCILGFLRDYGGAVLLDGRDTREMSRKELSRCVAYIPQASDQVFDYTVMELVLMGMASQLPLFATPGKAEEERVLEVLSELGIEHLAWRGCEQISGGEYQLVLLARTLVQQAKILIMDEPTANLDYGNQYRVMERIAGLSRRDFIVMTSTHDPNQVLLHATRAIALEDGAVSADGAPKDVMTEEVLSRLYGIEVHRKSVEDEGREVFVCIPAGLGGEEAEAGGEAAAAKDAAGDSAADGGGEGAIA